jgi:hypothetical protein
MALNSTLRSSASVASSAPVPMRGSLDPAPFASTFCDSFGSSVESRFFEVGRAERGGRGPGGAADPEGFGDGAPPVRCSSSCRCGPGGSAELVLQSRASRLGDNDMLIHQITQVTAGFIVGGYTVIQR